MNKSLYVDLETTGLNPKENGIVEIAALYVENGEIKDKFEKILKPFAEDVIEAEAMNVHGVDIQSDEAIDARDGYMEFIHFMGRFVDKYNKEDKMFLKSYSSFDSAFLRQFFNKNNDPYYGSWFYNPNIDMLSVIAYLMQGDRSKLKNFKLVTVAEYLGIKIKNAHRAMDDCYAMYDIEYELNFMQRLNDANGIGVRDNSKLHEKYKSRS